jgi:Swiss Army Knife RNA repair-like protein
LTLQVAEQSTETRRRLRKEQVKKGECLQLGAKPLLLCDIDGVISLWGFAPDSRPPGVWGVVDGIPHFLSTRAAEHLLSLTEAFDLVWCSGWEEKADEHLPHLLGVPSGRPHLTFEAHTRAEVSSRGHWKLAAIERYAGARPAAWVDDALDDACRAWAAKRAAPTLLLATDPAEGLTDRHAAALRDWAAGLGHPARGAAG